MLSQHHVQHATAGSSIFVCADQLRELERLQGSLYWQHGCPGQLHQGSRPAATAPTHAHARARDDVCASHVRRWLRMGAKQRANALSANWWLAGSGPCRCTKRLQKQSLTEWLVRILGS